jgi:hypothetical protein
MIAQIAQFRSGKTAYSRCLRLVGYDGTTAPDQESQGISTGHADLAARPRASGGRRDVCLAFAPGLAGSAWFPDGRSLIASMSPGDLRTVELRTGKIAAFLADRYIEQAPSFSPMAGGWRMSPPNRGARRCTSAGSPTGSVVGAAS